MPAPSRDDLAAAYLDQLPFPPYPVQEEALLAWFTAEQGVLVCAPTGTGKTLIAEAALYEALHTRRKAYYTTPLIALTEQKFQEFQDAAERWGFSRNDIGLVTGNRKTNPDALVLVVVAEILLNRLLHPEGFNFEEVDAVVMDEFHSFNDPERGVVWELSLALLPKSVRLLLLSATVGNAVDFTLWLNRCHGRKVQLVQGTERKVPLHFEWVGDMILPDYLESVAQDEGDARRTPALIFCFNRNDCWTTAEQLKGKSILVDGQQKKLAAEIDQWDWSGGAGPKLKTLLMRGVGVHHAGLLPKHRRRVEDLFQRKLLSVCVCTETLAAGINLPARAVVMTTLMKGPPGKRTLVDPSTAQQIFGRAGRPQFDSRGYVVALAHEDDVKIAKWKKQIDQIPEDTRDPNLIRARKSLEKKKPTRRTTEQYWNEQQFQKLMSTPAAKLASRGDLPWRLLAYLLKLSPDVGRLRAFAKRRLLEPKPMEAANKRLTDMLVTLWSHDFIELDPPPPSPVADAASVGVTVPAAPSTERASSNSSNPAASARPGGLFDAVRPVEGLEDEFGSGLLDEETALPPESPIEETPALNAPVEVAETPTLAASATEPAAIPASQLKWFKDVAPKGVSASPPPVPDYSPRTATPKPLLDQLFTFRTIHPLYAMFLLKYMGQMDSTERIQALESVLELSPSLLPFVRAPKPEVLPQGQFATTWLNIELLQRGLATPEQLSPQEKDDTGPPKPWEERVWVLSFSDKMRLLFEAEYPGLREVRTLPVWVVGDLVQFGGDFTKYISGRDLAKQEGLIFRHCLRMVLLCGEFAEVIPDGMDAAEWRAEMRGLADLLTNSCRSVDPESTDQILENIAAADVVVGEEAASPDQPA
ncbi:ski2-like helicase [Caulifigura coniformis]|uniref:Ski2-like helicase n=1 Tax=Caulifigura coniformis TaxID=2527983 RepID=A0A517SF27_9PLAN|nr:DEAD/DEAH box helicase [Caulifigura coniformis]QDT54736.1 ski2-like helicase [Caulifigura coniformis]